MSKNQLQVQRSTVLVAATLGVNPLVTLLENAWDEQVHRAVYFALELDCVRVALTDQELQNLVVAVFRAEPNWWKISWYSAYVSLLGHLFSGTATRSGWSLQVGLMEGRPKQNLFDTTAHRILRAADWCIHNYDHEPNTEELLRTSFLALKCIFLGHDSGGDWKSWITCLTTMVIAQDRYSTATLQTAKDLLNLVGHGRHLECWQASSGCF